ncbi:MAG: C40 family peptidase [Lachnospiraceae bacterium]|nr:C40 family peptidase [Lachnospiraceae bacterium]
MAYVLDEKDGFYYIESGDARGFIPKEDLSVGDHTDETVNLLGEEAFEEADADVEIPDNAAFTFTKTTTHDVVTEKDYAITYMSGAILEYPKDGARTVGEIGNGTLVYVLEDAGDGWLFVESGDVRGFVKASMLLTGEGAKAVTEDMGEGTISLAEEVITPEENRSLYYTLTSVKPAVDQMGESVCEYALSFEGKLPYVYGGTSLGFGADCSGFTQSVFGCFGISIPRTAQEQGQSGQVVNGLEDARPGDIIYYGSGPHVGIYLGDGKVIQCSGNESNTASNPGKGPTISAADYMPITSIRRYIIETQGTVPGISESGTRQDGSVYSQDQLELIWAIVAQEDNGSYEGALAVISSAMNRTESERWSGCGGDALTQLTAPGQYCYSLDDYWRPRLGGNVPEYVKQAVNDCLVKGIRNHNHTSFRSTKGKTTGNDAVQIGGNWYFGT